MTQWEYKTMRIPIGAMEKTLNKEGRSGWEAWSMRDLANQKRTRAVYFKRMISVSTASPMLPG